MSLLDTPVHPTLTIAALSALLVWRIYARVRRLVGRQRSQLWRHRGTMLMFPVLLGLLALGALGQPQSLWALAAGVAIGTGLAVIGLRLSRFEFTDEGPFYTPFAPIGIGLSALFVARLVYRVAEIAGSRVKEPSGLHDLDATPLTLLIFGTLASYYTAYAVGLLRWRRRVARAAPRQV